MSMISGKAKTAGVIGWPVAHSLSPRLHGYWLNQYAIDGVYIPLPIEPENIVDALRALPMLGFKGANVTVPHKEAALKIVDRVSDTARRIGAVNTIVCAADGSLDGDNTDAFGFITNVRIGAPHWQPATGPALVLGAGGAARAVVAALLDAGVPEVRLANRTPQRAETVARAFAGNITVVAWDERAEAADGAMLLVNTTTLGMTGKAPLEMPLDALPAEAVVNDIVYAPLQTQLLQDARARNLTTVDGLGMLLHQARPGFEAWFGTLPEVTEDLRRHVLGAKG